ncbi:MAG: GNAT family N-acetyltransferase [Oceanospirillaceae bacterium]|nr:GNAT family N-acetyltransferase [Oceanospirillaceae bacterium]
MNNNNLSLRPVTDKDEEFLFQVYASMRMDELADLDWSQQQLTYFINQQFQAQQHHYKTYFYDTEFSIILDEGIPIGRLYVDRRDNEIRIVEIALLTEYRNLGIGSYWLNLILKEAKEKNIVARIHVERYNPALNLYKKLGFQVIEEGDVYHLMECKP